MLIQSLYYIISQDKSTTIESPPFHSYFVNGLTTRAEHKCHSKVVNLNKCIGVSTFNPKRTVTQP